MASTINADTSNGVIITPDTSGEIELQANGVTKAKVTANGLQDANGNSLRGGMYRNLIINGDMQIAQRGTSVSGITSTTSYLTVDRFIHSIASLGTWTSSQDTDAPEGFGSSLKLECTASASLASNSIIEIQQIFEGQNLQQLKKGTANAESITISFWVKSNKIGDYVVGLLDNDNARDRASLYTINTANTWEKKTVTFEGDTTGALDNDNNGSLRIRMCLGAGTNFTTGTLASTWQATVGVNRAVGQTVNLADSTSNYINITGVQLEVGSGASDFEFLPYDVQLNRCQRYYTRLGKGAVGEIYTSTNGDFGLTFPVEMRSSPSVTHIANYNVTNIATGGYTVTDTITNPSAGLGTSGTMIRVTSSGMATGVAVIDSGNNVGFDSEL